MSDSDEPAILGMDSAPVVAFDVAVCHGVSNGGLIMTELAFETLVPLVDGGVRRVLGPVVRLRCGLAGAAQLRDALDAALKMLEQPDQAAKAAKLN